MGESTTLEVDRTRAREPRNPVALVLHALVRVLAFVLGRREDPIVAAWEGLVARGGVVEPDSWDAIDLELASMSPEAAERVHAFAREPRIGVFNADPTAGRARVPQRTQRPVRARARTPRPPSRRAAATVVASAADPPSSSDDPAPRRSSLTPGGVS